MTNEVFFCLQVISATTMIEWKEREHELDDVAALQESSHMGHVERLWSSQILQTAKDEERNPSA
jgi:hypothetical protein